MRDAEVGRMPGELWSEGRVVIGLDFLPDSGSPPHPKTEGRQSKEASSSKFVARFPAAPYDGRRRASPLNCIESWHDRNRYSLAKTKISVSGQSEIEGVVCAAKGEASVVRRQTSRIFRKGQSQVLPRCNSRLDAALNEKEWTHGSYDSFPPFVPRNEIEPNTRAGPLEG